MARPVFALDLGTTNTALAVWDRDAEEPRLLELEAICRRPEGEDPLEAPRLIPTALEFCDRLSLVDRLGAWPPLRRPCLPRSTRRHRPAGRRAEPGVARPAFVPAFKTALAADPLRPLARLGRRTFTARQAARTFLRELLAEVRRTTGDRISNLVVTVPVEAYESYRAELQPIPRSLGVRRVRFADEPVAAALGYGLCLDTSGRSSSSTSAAGPCTWPCSSSARRGPDRPRARARQAGPRARRQRRRRMDRRRHLPSGGLGPGRAPRRRRPADLAAAHAGRGLPGQGGGLLPRLGGVPGDAAGQTSRIGGRVEGLAPIVLDKAHLTEILRTNGFYALLSEGVDALFEPGGPKPEDVQDVLLVGGSTLLPGVFAFFEERFGRHRLRAWHPFESVAHGAACFAAERFAQADFIVHDYAFLTHDPKTNEPRHTVVVPKGTRFPSRLDLWKGRVVPTCPLGEPETLFKLVICEMGKADGARRFVWDASGDLHKLGGRDGDRRIIVPLNESNPALGTLDPPHRPGDRRPRLEVAFGVNGDRWLVATVFDLVSRELLMEEEPVVRLL